MIYLHFVILILICLWLIMPTINYVIYGCSSSRKTSGVITIQEVHTGGKTLLKLLFKIGLLMTIGLFQKKAFLFWCSFSIKLSWLQGRSNKINTILLYGRYYLQDCKALTSEKIANQTKYEKPFFPSHLYFSDWILIKQIIVSCTPFYCWGKQIFKRMLPGGMSNFLLPRAWWQELGEGGGGVLSWEGHEKKCLE